MIHFYDSVVAAAFSGAMLYTLIQRNFHGLKKGVIFLTSFFMGMEGADTAVSLLDSYLPGPVHIGRPMGAFICSVLIVKIAMIAISQAENFLKKKE